MIKNLNLELSSKARFDSIDGASLVEKDLPRKKFIINSLLASGLSIIAGSPKVGKGYRKKHKSNCNTLQYGQSHLLQSC